MKNKKITHKITQGVYVLTTNNGGCIVDAVSQISTGDKPLISVAVMKTNFTNKLLKENNMFALSVLAEDVNPQIIRTFGLNSMRNIDKFSDIEFVNVNGLNIISDSIGYMICEIVDCIDTGTHNLFIGRLVEADVFNEKIPMSYQYYQDYKDKFIKVVTSSEKTAWVCTICGYVYYGDVLPDDFKCPNCGVDRSLFEKK